MPAIQILYTGDHKDPAEAVQAVTAKANARCQR
jgi:hypothetical protein